LDIAGFVAIEPRGVNQLLKGFQGGSGDRPGIGKALEQCRSDPIDPFIGTLRRQDGRNKELNGGFVIEATGGIGVELREAAENFERSLLLGRGFSWHESKINP
jgi:hypothetical protein